MNIIATVHTLDAGDHFDQQNMNDLGIKIGDTFTVTDIDIHNWHTNVSLEGYSQYFNSVFFKFHQGEKELNIFEVSRALG